MAIDSVLGSTGTNRSIAVGGTVNGTIDAGGDQDWYRITLVAGQQYRFDLRGVASADGELSDPYLRLLNGAGTELRFNDDSGGTRDSSITFTAQAGGTYYLSAQGYLSSSGTFSLGATRITAGGDVPGNTSSTVSVTIGGSRTGTIGAGGDQDWYRVTLTAGHQYRFDLQGLSSGEGTLTDPFLRLLNAAGTQIGFNDDTVGSLDSSITFTASNTGTYYLGARAFSSADIGTFRLWATDLSAGGSGDIPANIGTSSSVAIGGSVNGRINNTTDEDWYRVTLVAGHEYQFDLRGFASGMGTLDDPVLRLLNGSGTEIAFNDDSGGSLDSRITYTPTQGGTYFLAAEGFFDSAGTFRLSAADLGGSGPDVPGGTGTAVAVAVGGSRTGTIGASGDQDWFRVSLVAGHQYRFDLNGIASGDGTLTDPLLRLLNGSGTAIRSNDDSGGTLDSSIAYTATATGTYFLSAQGYSSSTGTFRLSATELTGGTGDVPASTNTGSAVAVGGLVAGAVETSGDQDWYRITLVAGHQYRFDLRAYDSDVGTLDDPYLRLLNGSGSEIRFDDDSGVGLESRIVYSALQTGTYYLSAESYAGLSIGTFNLSVTDVNFGSVDIAGGTSTLGRVFVAGAVEGTVGGGGDQDWYQVTLVAGRQYRFELAGFDSDLGTLADPYLRLLNSTGVQIAFDDDSGPGLGSDLLYTISQTGTYYLSAESYAGYSSGTFRLSVSDASVDIAGGIATSRSAAMADSLTGTINTAGDQDWYRVTLIAGHQYVFDLQGSPSGQGTLADPLLRLLDSTGVALDLDDDSGKGFDASIIFVAHQSGTYYLSAEGYSSSTGTFTLSAFDLDDPLDVLAETGTGSSITMQSSVTGVLSPSGDEDWYEVQLVAGRLYTFDLLGVDSADGSLIDPYLRLLNNLGNQITFDDDAGIGRNSSIDYTAGYTGTYFLSAEGFISSAGTFTLSATDIYASSPPDVVANTGTTSQLTPGGSIAGTIGGGGDQDWYWINLIAGHEYHFDMRGADSGSGTLADPYLRLLDTTGTVVLGLDDDGGVGRDANLIFTPGSSTYYFLSAQAFAGSGSGTFVLSVTDGPADVLASTGTNGTLVAGGSVASTIDVLGDEDWYRVLLLGGHQYQFNLQGASSEQGTLYDPYLRLLDEFGFEITYHDDIVSGSNRDSRITYTASESGYYYVSAQAFNDAYTGTFSLSAVDLSSGDVAANIATGGRVTVGGTVTGTIGAAGDADWYRITLIAGRDYRFDLRGAHSGDGTLEDPYLRLLNSSGAEIASDDDSGAGIEARISYTPSQTGTYYLSAEDYWLSYTGTFSLSVIEIGGGDIPGNLATGAAVAVGASVAGSISAGGDRDWYKVTLVSGHQYRFDLQGYDSDLGTLDDPFLELHGSGGGLITFDDDSGLGLESSILYTAGASGVYYLEASDYALSEAGTFVLTVTDVTGGTVSGTSAANTLTGGEFDDSMLGLGGDDQVDGKGGDDTLHGGTGNDDLGGGTGNDSVFGDAGNDVFLQSTVESVGNDTLLGGDGADVFHDHFGRNVLGGGNGADLFSVYIAANSSTNLVTGGAGRDIYQVQPRAVANGNAAYVITDFEVGIGGDLLDVNALLDASAEARFFVPGASNASRFVQLVQSGPDTLLQWDRDGAGSAHAWKTYLTLKNIDADKVESGNFRGTVDVGTKFSDDLNGTRGNDLLAASGGNDTLDGGIGMDVMAGGNGSDRYYVDNAKDVVLESVAGLPAGLAGLAFDDALWAEFLAAISDDPQALDSFTDTVVAAITYSLGDVPFVENLTLTGTAVEGTGNVLNNVITGNGRANVLRGLGGLDTVNGALGNDGLEGGAGNDTLTGGGGQDRFTFNTALSATTNVDRIVDFSVVADRIVLDDDIFRALQLGTLTDAAFRSRPSGSAALDASDRIIYNEANGNLYYDRDGTGTSATATLFATLTGTPGIDASDFLIIA